MTLNFHIGSGLFRAAVLAGTALLIFGSAVSCASLLDSDYKKRLNLADPLPSDLTVEQIVARMHAATDPKDVFRNAKTYIMKQNVVSTDNVKQSKEISSVEVEFKAPDFLRITSCHGEVPFSILIFNQGRAFSQNPETLKFMEIPSGTPLNLITTFFKMSSPDVDLIQLFPSIDIGIVAEGKNRYYRLICRTDDENIAPYVLYVDADTFLTRRMDTIMYGNDGAECLYSAVSESYRWYNNVRLPEVTIVTTGSQQDISTVNKFVIDVDIPDSEFAVPLPFSHTVK